MPTRFLACSGGGDRGIILLGMMLKLYDHDKKNVEWSEVAGISAGGFCAAYVSQTTSETFLPMLTKLREAFFTGEFDVVSPWVWGGSLVNTIDAYLFHDSLYSNVKMKNVIKKWFDPSKIVRPLHLGTYDKTKYAYKTFSSTDAHNDMMKAVLASASVPAILPEVDIDGDKFQDGGMRHIIPVSEIKEWVLHTPGKKHVDVLVCYPIHEVALFTKMNIPNIENRFLHMSARMMSDMMLDQLQGDLRELSMLCGTSFDTFTANACGKFTHGDITLRILSPSHGKYTSMLDMNPTKNHSLFDSGTSVVKEFKLKL